MNKLLVAVAEQTHVVPTKLSVREFLEKEWLPAIAAHGTADDLPLLRAARHGPHRAHIATVKLAAALGGAGSTPSTEARQGGKRDGKSGSRRVPVHHSAYLPAQSAEGRVRWGYLMRNPLEAADPPKTGGNGENEMKTWNAEQLSAFLTSVRDERLFPLWRLLAMSGMRRVRPAAALG